VRTVNEDAEEAAALDDFRELVAVYLESHK